VLGQQALGILAAPRPVFQGEHAADGIDRELASPASKSSWPKKWPWLPVIVTVASTGPGEMPSACSRRP
jgi:hypothetical protein